MFAGRTHAKIEKPLLLQPTPCRLFFQVRKHLSLTFFPGISREVIGIVGDVKLEALNETRQTATLYVSLDQLTTPSTGGWRSFDMSLAVRAPSMNTVPALVDAVYEIDSAVPVQQVRSMDELISDSLSPQRFTVLLLAAFAGLALLLAAVGIYSVLSYAVRRRVHEIGIRMALGAQLSDVLRMVVIEGMKPTLIGVLIGLAGALALGRVLSSVIYRVSARDLAYVRDRIGAADGSGVLRKHHSCLPRDQG